jgi:RNA polymerase sigma factor (TIGR02999 family)
VAVVPGELTRLLERWGEGDRQAAAELIPLVYTELHAMARSHLRGERPGHTLQCTALIHEAYLRLVDLHGVHWQGRAQFFAIAAQVMRHILIDHARARGARKRGAGAEVVSLDEALTVPAPEHLDLAALDRSLTRLAAIDERKVRIVELRYFGGLSIDETAEVTGCSPTTVKREWTIAKAWLFRDLTT